MQKELPTYTYVETDEDLIKICNELSKEDWLCFDTEFVGEKRFLTLLCLIQLSSSKGHFIVDPLAISDLSPFLRLIEDPSIQKITHAGENDFRLLYQNYGILPSNIFDTQLASAFVGYKHPVAFSKLLEAELSVKLSKGYTVTDWESRPINKKLIEYALNDVIYLKELADRLVDKLESKGRLSWVEEEMRKMELKDAYEKNVYAEVIKNSKIRSLRKKEQTFFLRITKWRYEQAKAKNYSKEMILSSTNMNHIVRAIHSGKEALKRNRRLKENFINKWADTFIDMYERPITEEEREVLNSIPKISKDNSQEDLVLEMLNLLIKYKCVEEQMAPSIVLPRTYIKQIKSNGEIPEEILNGWRGEYLGESLLNWIKNKDGIDVSFEADKLELRPRVRKEV
jgi:ribonuclease D